MKFQARVCVVVMWTWCSRLSCQSLFVSHRIPALNHDRNMLENLCAAPLVYYWMCYEEEPDELLQNTHRTQNIEKFKMPINMCRFSGMIASPHNIHTRFSKMKTLHSLNCLICMWWFILSWWGRLSPSRPFPFPPPAVQIYNHKQRDPIVPSTAHHGTVCACVWEWEWEK